MRKYSGYEKYLWKMELEKRNPLAKSSLYSILFTE
jgi:hypothetical protein